VPALREHSRDIVLLVEHFSRVFAATTAKDPLTFSDAAMEALAAYRWPGNVRELRNEIWRLAASDARKVSPEDLSRRILRGGESQFQLPDGGGARRLEEIEREFVGGALLEALRRSHGNRTEAARQLGISRASLYRRLERYGLAAASRSVS
jgi:DNA-binding NtrC family response regulator